MGRRDLEFRVKLAAEGGSQAADEIAKVQREIQATRAGVAGFQQSGGLAALTDRDNQLSPAMQRVEALQDRIRRVRAEIDGVRQLGGLRVLSDGGDQISETIRRVDALIERMERAQEAVEATRGRISTGVAATTPTLAVPDAPQQFGRISDIDRSLRIIGVALGRFDNETLDQAVAFATITGDIAAVSEAAPRLALGIAQISSNIAAAIASTTAEITSKTASTAATQRATVAEGQLAASRGAATASGGRLGGALAGFTPALGVAGAAVAAAAVTLGAFQIATAGSRKETARLITAERNRLELSRQLRDLSAEAGQERIAELNQNIQQETEARLLLTRSARETFNDMHRMEQGFTRLSETITFLGTGVNDAWDEIDRYNESIREQEEELRAISAIIEARTFVAELREQLEEEQELTRLRNEASSEEVQSRLQAAREAVRLEQEFIERTVEEIARLQEAVDPIWGVITPAARDAIEELETAVAEAGDRMDDAARDAHELANEILPVTESREAELAAIEATEEAMQESLDARREEAAEVVRLAEEEAAEVIRIAEEAKEERERQFDELAKLNEQIADTEADRARTLARRAKEEALQASQDARKSDLTARLDAAKMQDALVQVRERGSARQIQVTENLVKQQEKALTDRNAQIAKLNTDFMRSELREIKDFNRKRQRLTEDLETGLLQAVIDNDVNRFIPLRDQAVTQLRRGDEDFGVERDRAGEDRDRAIADIESRFRAESDARQEAAQEQLVQIRSEQQQQTDTIRNAGRERLSVIEQLEQEGVRLQKVFADEKKALALRFEQQAHDERLALLRSQALELQHELGIIDATVSQNMAIIAANAGAAMAHSFAAAVSAAQQQIAVSVSAPISTSLTFGGGVSAQEAEQIATNTTQAGINGLARIIRGAF